MPNSITVIGCRAFAYCKRLRRLFIPKSVVKLEHSPFYECTMLEKIALPKGI